jgi:hypothetical protein
MMLETEAGWLARILEDDEDDEVSEGLRQRPGDQPLPVPNGNPGVHSMVIADVEARRDLGIGRYGTLLQAGNGRDALRDAYEEALDLSVYLRQAIEERDMARREGETLLCRRFAMSSGTAPWAAGRTCT